MESHRCVTSSCSRTSTDTDPVNAKDVRWFHPTDNSKMCGNCAVSFRSVCNAFKDMRPQLLVIENVAQLDDVAEFEAKYPEDLPSGKYIDMRSIYDSFRERRLCNGGPQWISISDIWNNARHMPRDPNRDTMMIANRT